jgi:hypothetical protein
MDQNFLKEIIMRALLPLWIIGAPLVLAIIDLIRTPKPTSSDRYTGTGVGNRSTAV